MREEDDDASSSSIDEPEHLLCPITRAMFRDPVFVPASGNTYERAALARFWSGSSRARDPLTNATLRSRSVYTNWDKRREVADWLTANPTTTPSGWDARTPPAPDPGSPSQLLRCLEASPATTQRHPGHRNTAETQPIHDRQLAAL